MRDVVTFNTDIDSVMIDGEGLKDEYVYEIDKIASDRYYREEILAKLIILLARKVELEEEQRFFCREMHEIDAEVKHLEHQKRIHFDHKNIVLEEALPEFENRIPYFEIYRVENMYPGVIEALIKIYEAGIYQEYNAPTAVNPPVEIVAKQKMCEKELPWLRVLGFKFFVPPVFSPGTHLKTLNRIPCDKPVKLVKVRPNMDIKRSVLVDDTQYIIDSARALGLQAYHRGKSDDTADIYLRAANDTIDLVHNGKIKKLSR